DGASGSAIGGFPEPRDDPLHSTGPTSPIGCSTSNQTSEECPLRPLAQRYVHLRSLIPSATYSSRDPSHSAGFRLRAQDRIGTEGLECNRLRAPGSPGRSPGDRNSLPCPCLETARPDRGVG